MPGSSNCYSVHFITKYIFKWVYFLLLRCLTDDATTDERCERDDWSRRKWKRQPDQYVLYSESITMTWTNGFCDVRRILIFSAAIAQIHRMHLSIEPCTHIFQQYSRPVRCRCCLLWPFKSLVDTWVRVALQRHQPPLDLVAKPSTHPTRVYNGKDWWGK
jgi:hypothetical protein